jgi:hypothetical protein
MYENIASGLLAALPNKRLGGWQINVWIKVNGVLITWSGSVCLILFGAVDTVRLGAE